MAVITLNEPSHPISNSEIPPSIPISENIKQCLRDYPQTHRYLKNYFRRQLDSEVESKRQIFQQNGEDEINDDPYEDIDNDGGVNHIDIIYRYNGNSYDYDLDVIVTLIIQNFEFWIPKYSQHDFTWQKGHISNLERDGRKTFGFVPEFHCQFLLYSIWDKFFNPNKRWSLFQAISDRDSNYLGTDPEWLNRSLNEIANPSRCPPESSVNHTEEIDHFMKEFTNLLISEKIISPGFGFNQIAKSAAKITA